MSRKYWHIPFLLIAMILSVYLRVINPWNSVFTWTVRLGGNDPWYYYRLIENCIHNFPNRIWFDPFTNYPYGTFTHFGPFLVYFSSIVAIITGHTSGEALRSVLAFIPTIAGTLAVLPMYLFASQVFNKRVGVISASLIAMIPGQYLQRSILGFNDHHCWETFWMITTLAFYVYALNVWKNFKDKKSLISAVLAGIAYGLYLDTWAPSFVFAMFLTTFVAIALIFEKYIKTNGLIDVTALTIGVATLLYLPFAFKTPFFSTTYYSPFQLIVLVGCIALLTVFKLVKRLKPYYERLGVREHLAYPLTFLILTALSVVILAVFAPQVLNMIIGVTGVIQPKGGMLTVAEVQPFFFMGGSFTLAPAWIHFGMTFFFGFFGFLYILYRLYRDRDSKLLLIVLWCIVMFIALWGQNRFAYYFALVTAFTSAVILDLILEKLRVYEYVRLSKGVSYTKVAIAILLVIILFYPTLALANEQSRYTGGPNKEWWSALTWMKNNTPDGNYDNYYYQLYKPSKNVSEPYPYPFKTYGVMSWWDYGHWIEAIAHRMPNANPFQEGIGNKYNRVPGASWFFTAFNESESEYVADKLNVKYVISDVEMLTGKYYAMAVWAEGSLEKARRIYYEEIPWAVYITPTGYGIAPATNVPLNARIVGTFLVPSEKWFETTEAKLHLLDCSGLSHYRLIYESKPVSQFSWMGFQEVVYKRIFDQRYAKKFGLSPVNATTSGYVKIFERVKGAKIYGKANASVVKVEVKVKTNQGRIFTYSNVAKVVNGSYEIVVPYAQNTTWPVKAITPYTVKAGNVTKTFTLSDEDVERGKEIRVDLI